MPPDLFTALTPRPDVLAGDLGEEIFAANLDEVAAGTAPEVYGDPQRFFASTHASRGLRELLDQVFGRLSGVRPDNASILRLETNLGGGKTHNLIGLLHTARGGLAPEHAAEFMDPALLPAEPVQAIGVFVGTSSGATDFPVRDGIKPRTIWGHLALQLGGAAAYAHIREDDEHLSAPGAGALKAVIGGQPALILIDELARYLATAQARAVGDSTLARQTTAFLMALIEAVSASARAVLVLTSTQVTDTFGDQTVAVLESLGEAMSIVARQEHVIRPSDEADLPRILARRLFTDVEATAAGEVAGAYVDHLAAADATGAELPERMTAPGWRAELERAYPFHPDLVALLDKRLSTNPNFQRTRGALRLLARVVRRLWEERPTEALLLHPHHASLRDPAIVEELTSRLDRGAFEIVVRADIASQPGAAPAHAEAIDAGRALPLARWLATTILLYSLTRDVPGVLVPVLSGDVLAPGVDHNALAKALEDLERSAWYLQTAEAGFQFTTEITLPRLIAEAERDLQPSKVSTEATTLLADAFKTSSFRVRRLWEDAKVPDQMDAPTLVLTHWESFGDDKGVRDPDAATPAAIQSVWENDPAGGKRLYRNELVFLAPSAETHGEMLRAVRRAVALRTLLESPSQLSALPDEQRAKLSDLHKEAALGARIAVCNHMNLLYAPRGGEPTPRLEAQQLDVVTQASAARNQTTAIEERLAADGKTLAAGDKVFDPGLFRARVGQQLATAMPTHRVAELFAQRADLKIVLDRAQLVRMVQAGVENGTWEYEDPGRGEKGWATQERPSAAFRLDAQTFLYPPGSAPPVPEEKGDDDGDDDPFAGIDAAPEQRFEQQGQAGWALGEARTAALSADNGKIRTVRIALEESGEAARTQLNRLFGLLSTATSGAEVEYDLRLVADLGATGQELSVRFRGPATTWQPLKSGVDTALQHRPADIKASAVATWPQPVDADGQELETLRELAETVGPAHCRVTLVPEPAS